MVKKAKQKIEKILRTKKAFKKAIFIIFKALLGAKIVSDLRARV